MSCLIRFGPSMLALLAFAVMAAEPVDEDTGRGLVDSFVQDITTFSAGFEQVLLDPDGELLFTSNLRSFDLDEARLAGLTANEITAEMIPPDFARRPRLRAWSIRPAGAEPQRRPRP